MTTPSDRFDTDRAAEYIGMSAAFLIHGRCRGLVGNRTPTPPYRKFGRLVKYDKADLDAWLAARPRIEQPAKLGGAS